MSAQPIVTRANGKMKVRVEITVEIDPDAWYRAYGNSGSMRTDVKEYCVTQVQGSAAADECGLEVKDWK